MPLKNSKARREYDKAYRLKNQARIQEYDRQRSPGRYWKNPDGNRVKRRRYYYRHQETELNRKRNSDEKIRADMEIDFRCNPQYLSRMWRSAKMRAKKCGVPFDITPDDIVIPEFCPVLGIKLAMNRGHGFQASSPSLDRRTPNLGYVKGNVFVISYRANEIKRDATLEELKSLVRYLQEE